jgi:hypothetical protein
LTLSCLWVAHSENQENDKLFINPISPMHCKDKSFLQYTSWASSWWALEQAHWERVLEKTIYGQCHEQEQACQTWLCIGLWLIWLPVNNLHHPFITTHVLQTLIIFFIEIGIDQKEYRSRRSHVSLRWTYVIKRWFLHHSILLIQPHPLRSHNVFHNPDTLLDLHWYTQMSNLHQWWETISN